MECASALASSNVGGQLHANELGTGDEKNKGKGETICQMGGERLSIQTSNSKSTPSPFLEVERRTNGERPFQNVVPSFE
jgi:hypothetical protein